MKFISGAILLYVSLVLTACVPITALNFSEKGNVALIEVKGAIIDPEPTLEDFRKFEKNSDLKAAVVRVDSPGGSVAASQEIARTIKRINKKKPIVISMGDIAASGGYYISAPASSIFANEGTVTGSIGVRFEHVDVSGLLEWMRVKPETLKSGRYKDISSPYRELSGKEREIIESFLSELHEQFKKDISESRGINKAKIDEIADGRIFTGAAAKKMGLVDEMGGIYEAKMAAAELAGIKTKPKIFKMRKEKAWWLEILSDKSKAMINDLFSSHAGKYFLYEWRPYKNW